MKAFHPAQNIIIQFLLLCILFPAIVACDTTSRKARPAAVHGVMDLRGWNFIGDGPVNLDGEWEFCWDRLLQPSDFTTTGSRDLCGVIAVPGLWKGREVNGINLSGKGEATYRLTILSNEETRVSLAIHRIFSVYRLWINGVLADKKGILHGTPKSREDYIFIHNKKLTSFALHPGANEIILHVLNMEYESGGIDRPLVLDDAWTAAQSEFRNYTINMIIVGLLVFASLYNIMVYFFRKTDTTSLYIGYASFVWAINTYNIQSPILTGVFSYPGNPFFINYSTVILGTILCMMIMHSLFPGDFSLRVIRCAQVIVPVFIVLLFFVGFRMAERIMYVFYIMALIVILYGTYVLVKTLINRRDDAGLFFAGLFSIFVAGINNLLYVLWIANTGNIMQYAMVVLCFVTTMVVSRRFARALRTVEILSLDLTEKNISLQKLDHLKDEILANTSHELRTPLHGMIGLAESMIQGAAGELPPRVLDNLSLIASSGHRLANMVNDLLDMAKIQDEGLNLIFRPVDLYSLSEMVVKLSRSLVGGKPLEIINTIQPDIPVACADEDRIRQVLYNLVGNAIKFTNQGTVELSARVITRVDDIGCRDGETMIEVSVSDTGIGIPDDYKEKIFESYQQVDGSDTRSYAGTGLGLAIAKKIIEFHNGTITVASGPQGGSVFSFTLPEAGDPVPETMDGVIIGSMNDVWSTNDASGPFRLPACINDGAFDGSPAFLVVDDDPVNVKIIQNFFESMKCVVRTAPDGISALDSIERGEPVDLVLLDIMMPVMSGYDVCKRIRINRSPEELPVIMLTAKNMMSDIDAAFEAGANDYIVKPFKLNELLARVSTMLRLRNIRKSAIEGITIHARNRAYSIKFGTIIYITSHSKNVVIHTLDGEIEVPVLMKEVAGRLPPDIFVRIHKSHIINIGFVHSISHVLSGRYRVRLNDNEDTELPVGPAFLDGLRKKI